MQPRQRRNHPLHMAFFEKPGAFPYLITESSETTPSREVTELGVSNLLYRVYKKNEIGL